MSAHDQAVWADQEAQSFADPCIRYQSCYNLVLFMGTTIIANPVLNSPFAAPQRHFRFVDNEITDQIAPGRRESGHHVPIARARARDGQMTIGFGSEKYEQNPLVNAIRARVGQWRASGSTGELTHTTRRLLEHWSGEHRANG